MSNTRYASPGAELRQGKYASSPELREGLLANLVTKRCRATSNQEERRLIQALQWLSHQEGGLTKVAKELVDANPSRIVTPGMLSIRGRGGVYSGEESALVRGELPISLQEDFPLCRFPTPMDCLAGNDSLNAPDPHAPEGYPSADFRRVCREAAVEGLADWLADVCLNPAVSLMDLSRPWYFRELGKAVGEYLAGLTNQTGGRFVRTELTRAVFDTLDYGLETRCMVVVEGLARTGKTFAASAWCDLHPGRVRYVQVPSTGDDIGFFRAVSEGLGSSSGSCLKATQMREKIEDTLRGGEIMVVFDEAHYLLPQRNLRYAIPNRLNWVMTALVNRGVPVALVTTPQFSRSQRAIEQKTGWASEQFIGRIGHWQRLPDRLSETDLQAISRHLLPNGDGKSIEALVAYAQASSKYLAGIESAARHARYLAAKAGRDTVSFLDVKDAIQGGVIPSDTALAMAFGAVRECGVPKMPNRHQMSGRKVIPVGRLPEAPVQTRVRSGATPVHSHNLIFEKVSNLVTA